MIRPVNELWDSKILTIFLEDNNLFNLETRFSGKEANSKILFLILNEEIFFVYFGSINFPDHFFNVLITLALVFFLLSYFLHYYLSPIYLGLHVVGHEIRREPSLTA